MQFFSRRQVAVALAAFTFLAGGAPGTRAQQTAPAPAQVTVPREVLAYYYAWWSTPAVSGRWGHWRQVNPQRRTIENSRFYPADGPYDSQDPKLDERHAAEAARAGITGWVYSWWGPGSIPDRALPGVLAAAGRHKLKVAVAIEQLIQGDKRTKDQEVNRRLALDGLTYILTKYAGNPAYLHVGNRPVVFINRVALHQIRLRDWAEFRAQVAASTRLNPFFAVDGRDDQTERAQLGDAIYNYDTAHETANKPAAELRAWAPGYYRQRVGAAGSQVAISVILPGHDASELVDRPNARNNITDRMGGQALSILWQAAIAADPDWVLIVSWNEWHEGSQLEPSVEFGDSALAENAKYARQFLALRPKTHVLR